MKMRKVTLRGGFHGRPEITIRLPYCEFGGKSIVFHLDEHISAYQRRRLERHFCGVPGCCCGSWTRAEMETLASFGWREKRGKDGQNQDRSDAS